MCVWGWPSCRAWGGVGLVWALRGASVGLLWGCGHNPPRQEPAVTQAGMCWQDMVFRQHPSPWPAPSPTASPQPCIWHAANSLTASTPE